MSLTERETHFEFGENWEAYAKTIDQSRIDSAVVGLQRLFPDGIGGKTFLDIGCGSGIHALAALQMGAASVAAVDIDEISVRTTQALLAKHAPGANWTASVKSVFDLSPGLGTFDIVYSWGVLHHTGDMWRAIETAAKMVAPNGLYAIAIYTKSPISRFWQREKAVYSRSPKFFQWVVRMIYMGAFLAYLPTTNYKPISFVRNYKASRGMNFSINVHDWLGGYPYDAASPLEIRTALTRIGLVEVASFPIEATSGWSEACSEYVFRRPQTI
jgi:2-polyprenyl-6-hydroxyphenyl methylase/3-demethylubiquinone-9 3-methyltransferase